MERTAGRERPYTGYLCEVRHKGGLLHNACNLRVFIREDIINRGGVSLDGQRRLPKDMVFSRNKLETLEEGGPMAERTRTAHFMQSPKLVS